MSKNIKILRNSDIKSVTIGTPGKDHIHIRTAIETDNEIIVLQEATIAAIIRAYTTIKTHPVEEIIHLKGKEMDNLKPGYAKWQLIEEEDKSQALEMLRMYP